MDEARRRDKLDDALLFLTASVGILFGILQAYVRPSTLLQFLIPVGLLALILPFFFGFARGAVRDSMVDRYRGWVLLIFGSGLYAIMITQEEAVLYFSPNPLDPFQEGVVTIPFVLLGVILLRQAETLRKFVLGPTFPGNPVLRISARYAVKAALAIIVGGIYLVIIDSLKLPAIWDLGAIGIAPFAIFYIRKSNYFATRVDWPSTEVEKPRWQQFVRYLPQYRALSDFTFYLFVGAGVVAVAFWLNRVLSFAPQPFLQLYVLIVVGIVAILTVPVLILYSLTRTVTDFGFNGPYREKVEEDI